MHTWMCLERQSLNQAASIGDDEMHMKSGIPAWPEADTLPTNASYRFQAPHLWALCDNLFIMHSTRDMSSPRHWQVFHLISVCPGQQRPKQDVRFQPSGESDRCGIAACEARHHDQQFRN